MSSPSYSVFIVGDHEVEIFAAPKSGKAHLATKIIVKDGHASWLDSKGKMFSTYIVSGKWAHGRNWGSRGLAAIKDAVALGVVPKTGSAEVVRAEEERRKRREIGWQARSAIEHMAAAGVALTPGQKRDLQRKARAGEKA